MKKWSEYSKEEKRFWVAVTAIAFIAIVGLNAWRANGTAGGIQTEIKQQLETARRQQQQQATPTPSYGQPLQRGFAQQPGYGQPVQPGRGYGQPTQPVYPQQPGYSQPTSPAYPQSSYQPGGPGPGDPGFQGTPPVNPGATAAAVFAR